LIDHPFFQLSFVTLNPEGVDLNSFGLISQS